MVLLFLVFSDFKPLYFSDIDECSQKHCDQVCVNTPGSYKCFCDQGYELDIDDRSCIREFTFLLRDI